MNDQSNHPWAIKIPGNPGAELDSMEETVGKFKTGAISEAEFRAVRVPQGIYEQRESGTYMLRLRCPAGAVLPGQLRRLADVAARWGNGVLHVTTRQEFQVHRVPLESIVPALRALAETGLSSKGGGGNTVRNITACFDSGVCAQEIFDVAPYAVAVTERLLADPLSLQLPRKYKIAFAACERDCAGATVQDAGFIARKRDGVEGFAVYVGGGMGGKSRVASLLHSFVPAPEALNVAEAIKRVFDKYGDRKNKHLARLRFVVERMGLEGFRELYEKELEAVRRSKPDAVELRPFPARAALQGGEGAVPKGRRAFERWFKSNVTAQKQPGFFLVHIPLELGDLPAHTARALADIVESTAAQGDGVLLATQSQNAVLRWVAGAELVNLFDKLDGLGLAEPQPPILRNLVACAGASTCRLGICLSRGLAKAINRELRDEDEESLDALGDLTVHISGCPNSCGRHPVGNIGLSGAARRVEGKLAPYYAVQIGGRVEEGMTRFGVNAGAVPARNAPAFVKELLAAWRASEDAADFHRFADNGGQEIARALIERHQQAPLSDRFREFYLDWDAVSDFSLAGRGQGECSAGVFDLIEVDLANARESLEAGRFYAAAYSACHALLVTKGLQPSLQHETFDLFLRHFIGEGLVDESLAAVVSEGARSASAGHAAEVFKGAPAEVTALLANVRVLYEGMDASLRFKAGK